MNDVCIPFFFDFLVLIQQDENTSRHGHHRPTWTQTDPHCYQNKCVPFIANCRDLTNTSRLDELRTPFLTLHVIIDACKFLGVPLRTCYHSVYIGCEKFSCFLPIMMTPC